MAPLEWYYAKDNRQQGPVSAAELKQLAAGGELRPGDLVWCEKLDDWTPAKKVGGLFDDDAGGGPPKPVEPPPKAGEALPKAAKLPPKPVTAPPKQAPPPH